MTDKEKVYTIKTMLRGIETIGGDNEYFNATFNNMTVGELKESFLECDNLISQIKSILEE
jgi:hypothetical protein